MPGVIAPSQYPLPSLEKQLRKTAYAVFIFARDDKQISRGRKFDSTRDNVILEFGLFVGKLGSEKCFVVIPKNRKGMKIPSDLDGFTFIQYDDELFTSQPETAMLPVGTAIRSAIQRLSDDEIAIPTIEIARSSSSAPDLLTDRTILLSETITDMLSILARGDAGVRCSVSDKLSYKVWSQTVLKNALHILKFGNSSIPDDTYIAWLKPKGRGTKRKLSVFVSEKLPENYSHYEFGLNEGIAGTVWEEGRSASHMRAKPHPRWVIRPGCDNASYACAVVGNPGGAGGVLSFGSDQGFPIDPSVESMLRVFAGLMALCSDI